MRLIPDWRVVLRRAWSIRFIALAAVCDFVAEMWPILIGDSPPRWLALAGAGFTLLALVARFVLQPKMRGDADR